MADMEIAIGRFRRCYTRGSYLQQRLMAVPAPLAVPVVEPVREAPGAPVDIDIEAFVREHEASERRNGRVDKARTDSTHDDGPLVGDTLGDNPPADDSSAASSATRAAAIRSPDEFLAADSALARAIPGFIARPQQVELATAICADDRAARPADRRGGHRHRQDVRVSGAGAAVGRQGDHLHRHEDAAGPAVPARPADGARGAQCAGDRRAAQGPRELRLPLSSGADVEGRPAREPHRRALPARDRALRQALVVRRQGGAVERPGERGGLVACHVDARQLPRLRLPDTRRMLRDEGAARGARRPTWSSSIITCSSPT